MKEFNQIFENSHYHWDSIFSKFLNFDIKPLQSFLKKTRRGLFLIGYRILGKSEQKEDGEIYYSDLIEKKIKLNEINNTHETNEQFYDRVCNDFNQLNKLNNLKSVINEIKYKKDNNVNGDSNIDIHDEIKQYEINKPKYKEKENKTKEYKQKTSDADNDESVADSEDDSEDDSNADSEEDSVDNN